MNPLSQEERLPESGGGTAGSQTLLRGLDVIEALVAGALPLTELSGRLDLTRSTTHRLATALVERRLLNFQPREGYSLGPKLLELGYAAAQQMHLPRVARPWLEDLAAQTSDTVHLGVLDGRMALYLDKVPGRRRVSIGSRIGERHSLHSTALGKALILDMTEGRWRELYRGGIRNAGPTAMAGWLERMRDYARAGRAFDLEENEERIRCVAAPIRGGDGAVLAAVSVSSAAQYMDDARMQALGPVVQDVCERISREFGWAGAVAGSGDR